MWKQNNYPIDTTGRWNQVSLTINLLNGDPRFFIEAQINQNTLSNYGVAAISKIEFVYEPCIVNNAKPCGYESYFSLPTQQSLTN